MRYQIFFFYYFGHKRVFMVTSAKPLVFELFVINSCYLKKPWLMCCTKIMVPMICSNAPDPDPGFWGPKLENFTLLKGWSQDCDVFLLRSPAKLSSSRRSLPPESIEWLIENHAFLPSPTPSLSLQYLSLLWWAAILKNVSIKAILINNLWEKIE